MISCLLKYKHRLLSSLPIVPLLCLTHSHTVRAAVSLPSIVAVSMDSTLKIDILGESKRTMNSSHQTNSNQTDTYLGCWWYDILFNHTLGDFIKSPCSLSMNSFDPANVTWLR